MIRLVKRPETDINSVEGIRIGENYKVYGDYALFWHQNGGKTVISMLDGDMIISGDPDNYEELSAFVNMISPRSVFSSSEILKGLGLFDNSLIVSVLSVKDLQPFPDISDELSSKEVYFLLKTAGFTLPDHAHFATDYCSRLNKGRLDYFAIKDTAVSMCIGRKNVLINGMVSLKKGYGSKCLNGLLSKVRPEKAFVCAKRDVETFYIKNGFEGNDCMVFMYRSLK